MIFRRRVSKPQAARVWQRSNRILTAIERQRVPIIAKALQETASSASAAYRLGGPIAALMAVDAAKEKMKKAIAPIWRQSGLAFSSGLRAEAKACGLCLRTKKDDQADIFFERWLSQFAGNIGEQRLEDIGKTTKRRIENALYSAAEDGLGVDETASTIEQSAGSLSRGRAVTIARTEGHIAGNLRAG